MTHTENLPNLDITQNIKYLEAPSDTKLITRIKSARMNYIGIFVNNNIHHLTVCIGHKTG